MHAPVRATLEARRRVYDSAVIEVPVAVTDDRFVPGHVPSVGRDNRELLPEFELAAGKVLYQSGLCGGSALNLRGV